MPPILIEPQDNVRSILVDDLLPRLLVDHPPSAAPSGTASAKAAVVVTGVIIVTIVSFNVVVVISAI